MELTQRRIVVALLEFFVCGILLVAQVASALAYIAYWPSEVVSETQVETQF